MTGYVVRDRRVAGQWLVGLLGSVVVVVAVCAATGRWWVAAVGLPLSLLVAGRRIRAGTAPLRADHDGVTLEGRWTGWRDVEDVTVTGAGAGCVQVRVTLRPDAPLPPWSRGRVTGGEDDRRRLSATVRGDVRACEAGIRGQAPASVAVGSA